MPYVLSIKDNWDRHEGTGSDLGSYATAAEAVAAAHDVIDRSLKHIWQAMLRDEPGKATAKALYDCWTFSGDNTYILAVDGAPAIEPRFDPYAYAEKRAGEIAQAHSA